MTEVRCPLCLRTVAADGETALSHRLEDHLAAVHDIRVEGREPHRGPLAEATPAPPRPPVPMGPGQGVRCPLCGRRIAGDDIDALSDGLRAHFEGAHQLSRSSGRDHSDRSTGPGARNSPSQ